MLERRIPVTEYKYEKKAGRYYIKDPALRFWFRYIFRNQSLIEIGDERGLTGKIMNDLPTMNAISEAQKKSLEKEGVLSFDMKSLLRPSP